MNKPPATKGETCPFNGKDVSRVCHHCPLYVQVRGRDNNTGRDIDHWGCSFSFLPMMLIENIGQQRQTGAAVESFRNETIRGNNTMAHSQDNLAKALLAIAQVHSQAPSHTLLIEAAE